MSDTLRIILFLSICIYFIIVFHLLKKNDLELKYSLIWLGAGFIMLICVIWPELVIALTEILGIELPVNTIFVFGHIFEVLILMVLTLIVSKNKKRMKDLVQQNGILEKRVRELEQVVWEKVDGEQK